MLLENMEPITQKFYDGLAEGKLLARKCKECGAIEFPPHLGCNACGYHETEWVELSGKGTLESFVVPGIQNDKPYLKAFQPYGYGKVKLDEGAEYTFVIFCGKKKVVKGLQQRLYGDKETIRVHLLPFKRETPEKEGSDKIITWYQPCMVLDEVEEA